MPIVGTRKAKTIGDFSRNEMYPFASKFLETQKNILSESRVDYLQNPCTAMAYESAANAMREFFVEDSMLNMTRGTQAAPGSSYVDQQAYQDNQDMMNEAFINDMQAVRENAVAGLNMWNPIVGLSLPMHKYLMLNCVFAQAMPRFVSKSPSWTESVETRYMIDLNGKRIDIANQQNQIYKAWKQANPPVEVPVALPECRTTDILDEYFSVNRRDHNLDVSTHISAIAVEDMVKKGEPTLTIGEDGTITEGEAAADGVALTWKPWEAKFNPGYGDANRVIVQPVDIMITNASGVPTEMHDTLFASQADNLFEISSAAGKIRAVKLYAKYDPSARTRRTPRVEWRERTQFYQIGNNDGITIPITPEEVKDINAMYGINQITKYMSMIKDILENTKDDTIHEYLDDSFMRLDDDHKVHGVIDFAPRQGYYSDHLEWLQKTFMNTLDQYITGLLTILRDPNMEINIIGRPGLIRQITPISYSYTSSDSAGPIQLDFRKTVVTSDKRVYNFISSYKLMGSDALIIMLNPKNTNRIVYRLYDYQMYISNEIRDAENPQLPALTAFERYLVTELFPCQARIHCANPTGLREHLPLPKDPLGRASDTELYVNNDLHQVKHWNNELRRNVTVEEETAALDAAADEGDGG